MKRITSALIVLCLAIAGLVFSAPAEVSQATTSWPLQLDGRVAEIVAGDEGQIIASSCIADVDKPLFRYFDPQGNIRNSVLQPSEPVLQCDTRQGIGETALLDGTFYATTLINAGGGVSYHRSKLVAYKNDRQIWEIDTSAPANCTGGTDRRYKSGSLSIGSDGNLYAVLTPVHWASNCPIRYVSIDRDTHVMTEFATASSIVTTFSGVVKMWTYDDVIRFIDRAGTVYEYAYEWEENVPARYTFPLTYTWYFYYFTSHPDGTVFANTANCCGWGSGLLYHKADGSSGSINTPNGYGMERFIPGSDGQLLQFYGYTVNSYNPVTDSVSNILTLVNSHSPSYPNGEIVELASDEDGNLIVVSQYASSNWLDRLISVDFIESGTTTLVNLFEIERDGDSNPVAQPFDIDRSIANGYLYLSLCHQVDYIDCVTPSTAESWIHKIELTGFGDVVQDRYDYSGYESTKLEYVAMGDSFSSGEGVEPFLPGTDEDTVNECHRSEDAYPMLLDEDPTSDLNLTAFVACSGATTWDISHEGQWSESRQDSALSDSTDIVTVSIGGNDVAFSDYIFACIVATCGPFTNPVVYDAMTDGISAPAFKTNLILAYEAILEEAPNASAVYVVDYPYMTTALQSTCNTVDMTGAFLITTAINSVIHDAVSDVALTDSRLILVDTNAGSSPFIGGEICGMDPHFNAEVLFPEENRAFSYHPNNKGHVAYLDVIKGVIP